MMHHDPCVIFLRSSHNETCEELSDSSTASQTLRSNSAGTSARPCDGPPLPASATNQPPPRLRASPPASEGSTAQTLPGAAQYIWELRPVRPLGRGSFGVVSLVEALSELPDWFPDDVDVGPFDDDDALARSPRRRHRPQLVLKEMSLQGHSAATRRSLWREVRTLRTVKHPNVVRFIDSSFDATENRLMILMEYCDGGDLSSFVDAAVRRAKGVSEPQLWVLAIQLLCAIRTLHDSFGIVHRDIKPRNVFLTSAGVAKLGDFGVSGTLRHAGQQMRRIAGSLCYMAPEIADSAPYDHRADLWSLGCVLYEVATGGIRAFGCPRGEANAGSSSDGAAAANCQPEAGRVLADIAHGNFVPVDARVICRADDDRVDGTFDASCVGFGPEVRTLITSLLRVDPLRRPTAASVLAHVTVKARAASYLPLLLLRTEPYREVFGGSPVAESLQSTVTLLRPPTSPPSSAAATALPAGAAMGSENRRRGQSTVRRSLPPPMLPEGSQSCERDDENNGTSSSSDDDAACAHSARYSARPQDASGNHVLSAPISRQPSVRAPVVFPRGSPMILFGVDHDTGMVESSEPSGQSSPAAIAFEAPSGSHYPHTLSPAPLRPHRPPRRNSADDTG